MNCAFRLKIVALMIVIILCGHFFFGSHKNAVGQQSVYRKRIFQHLHYLVSCPIVPTCGAKKHVHVAGPFDVIERIPEILCRLLLDD